MAALDSVNTGSENTALGHQALTAIQGQRNVAAYLTLGAQDFTSATNAYNTAVGYNAGAAVTTGQNNDFIGGLVVTPTPRLVTTLLLVMLL